MAKANKADKKRADKYDPKLSIKGSFEDVIKVSVASKRKQEQPVKNEKKNTKSMSAKEKITVDFENNQYVFSRAYNLSKDTISYTAPDPDSKPAGIIQVTANGEIWDFSHDNLSEDFKDKVIQAIKTNEKL